MQHHLKQSESHQTRYCSVLQRILQDCVRVCVRAHARSSRLLYKVCALSYTAVLSPTVWDATSVCVRACVCVRHTRAHVLRGDK